MTLLPRHGLSPRQTEVLTHVSNGLSIRDIAEQIHLSTETVRTHLKGVFDALGAHNQAHAVALAYRSGIFTTKGTLHVAPLDLTRFRDTCLSCHHTIVWAQTTSGRSTPVTAEPTHDGAVMLGLDRGILRASILSRAQVAGAREQGRPLYRSHFADCPDSRRWRRRDQS